MRKQRERRTPFAAAGVRKFRAGRAMQGGLFLKSVMPNASVAKPQVSNG